MINVSINLTKTEVLILLVLIVKLSIKCYDKCSDKCSDKCIHKFIKDAGIRYYKKIIKK